MDRVYVIMSGLKYLAIAEKKIVWIDDIGSVFLKKFSNKDEVTEYIKNSQPLSKDWTIASYFR